MTTEYMVECAARAALADVPGVEFMYAVADGESHPMAPGRRGSWRVVLQGWHASLHNGAIHQVVTPPRYASMSQAGPSITGQLHGLARDQARRAADAYKAQRLERPLPRCPFEADGVEIDIRHIRLTQAAFLHILHHEGSAEDARRRVARLVNAEILKRERANRPRPGRSGSPASGSAWP